jgi:hypothetical protein
MTALTAPLDVHEKDSQLIAYPMAANTTIFKGALIALTGGYAKPGADTASVIFVGVAHETKVNQATTALPGGAGFAGAAGALLIRVRKVGSFVYNRAASTVADLGKAVQIVDDNTVATTGTTNSIQAGYIVEVPSVTQVRVRIDRAVQ